MTLDTAKKLNTTSLSDEKFVLLSEAGFTTTEIERWYAQIEYRREYNSRPDVVTRRKEYTQKRNARLSLLSKLLKGGE